MKDIKYYIYKEKEEINEKISFSLPSIAIQIAIMLAIKFSPEIKKGLNFLYEKTSSNIMIFLQNKFPKLINNLENNVKIQNLINNKDKLIEVYKKYMDNTLLSENTIMLFCELALASLSKSEVNEILKTIKEYERN